MSDSIGTVYVEIGAKLDGLASALNSVQQQLMAAKGSVGETQGAFGQLWAQFAIGLEAANILAKGISFVTGSFKDSIGEAAAYEKAVATLNATFTASGRDMPGMVKNLKDYADEIMRSGMADDTAALKAEALLLRVTDLNEAGIKEGTRLATGLSKVYGMDLNSAAELVGKGLDGVYRGFTSIAPQIMGATTDAEKHTVMMKFLNDTYVAAQAQMEGYSGQVQKMGINWGEAKKQFGEAVLSTGILQTGLQSLSDVISGHVDPAFVKLLPEFKFLGEDIQAAVSQISPLISSLKILTPSFQELYDIAKMGPAAWDDYSKGIKQTDEYLTKNKDSIVAWMKSGLESIGLLDKEGKAHTETGPPIKEHTAALKTLKESLDELSKTSEATPASIAKLQAAFDAATKSGKLTDEELKPIADRLDDLNIKGGTAANQLQAIANKFQTSVPLVKELGFDLGGFALALYGIHVPSLDPPTGPTWQELADGLKTSIPLTQTLAFDMAAFALSVQGIYIPPLDPPTGPTWQELADQMNTSIPIAKNLAWNMAVLALAFQGIHIPDMKIPAPTSALVDWTKVAKDIGDVWKRGLADMISGTKSFSDVVVDLWKSISVGAGSAVEDLVTGALSGLGALAGPIGAVAGGLASGLVSGIGNLLGIKSAAQEAAEAAAKLAAQVSNVQSNLIYLGSVSDATAKKFLELKAQFGAASAEAQTLGKMMSDTGITMGNFKMYGDKLLSVLIGIQEGSIDTATGVAAADDAFQKLLDGAKALGLEGSANITAFIIKAREMGLEIPSMTAYCVEQLDKIPASLKLMIDEGGNSETALKDLGNIALLTFNSMLASGVSWTDAVTKMQDPLKALAQKYKDLGLEADPALAELMKIVGVTEAHKDLFDALSANDEVLKALGNSGFLTADAMKVLCQKATDYYGELQKSGLTADEALRAMGPTLQDIYDYSKRYGITLDANTQLLIDQAKAAGIVKDKVDIGDTLGSVKDILQHMLDIFKSWADAVGLTKRGVEDLGNAIGSLPSLPSIPTIPTTPGGGTPGTCFIAGTPITMADGSRKPIEAVAVGDAVRSWDVRTWKPVVGCVAALVTHEPGEVGRIVMVNGIGATPEHPFYVNGGWRQIGNANIGDHLVSSGGWLIDIFTKEWQPGGVRVYNLTLENVEHDYFVGGVLVHNVSQKPGYAESGIAWTPQIASVAETKPEIIMGLDDYLSGNIPAGLPAPGVKGGGGITLIYSPTIQAMDSQDVYKFLSGKGADALLSMIKSNVRGLTRELSVQVGKYT